MKKWIQGTVLLATFACNTPLFAETCPPHTSRNDCQNEVTHKFQVCSKDALEKSNRIISNMNHPTQDQRATARAAATRPCKEIQVNGIKSCEATCKG